MAGAYGGVAQRAVLAAAHEQLGRRLLRALGRRADAQVDDGGVAGVVGQRLELPCLRDKDRRRRELLDAGPAGLRALDSVLETCRRFYNDCLAERKTAYEERGETVGKVPQLRRVKDLKETNPYAKDVHSPSWRRPTSASRTSAPNSRARNRERSLA
jgi:hypothetical protein